MSSALVYSYHLTLYLRRGPEPMWRTNLSTTYVLLQPFSVLLLYFRCQSPSVVLVSCGLLLRHNCTVRRGLKQPGGWKQCVTIRIVRSVLLFRLRRSPDKVLAFGVRTFYTVQRRNVLQPSEKERAVQKYVDASPKDGGRPDTLVVVLLVSVSRQSQVFTGLLAEMHSTLDEF